MLLLYISLCLGIWIAAVCAQRGAVHCSRHVRL